MANSMLSQRILFARENASNTFHSYGGYLVDQYAYTDNAPDTIGWSTQATDLGFVSPEDYQSPDIICHEDAKPGALTAPVKAGSKIEMQWTEWPESHHGPILNYLAPCNGDCSKVDKTSLKFFKIDAQGLIDGSNPPGTWASDNMIENNNTYTFTMSEAIADGNYVLRHELIALHSAGQTNGAQNYVQCVNIKVTGGGDACLLAPLVNSCTRPTTRVSSSTSTRTLTATPCLVLPYSMLKSHGVTVNERCL